MASIARAYRGSAAVAIQGDSVWHPSSLISTDENRWSRAGEPTIYLAGDSTTALAELARHLPVGQPVQAWVWTVHVSLNAVVDLRSNDTGWVTDRTRCREVAADFRRRRINGLIVPSVAFLDQPERRNLVIFAERLPDLDKIITGPRPFLSVYPVPHDFMRRR